MPKHPRKRQKTVDASLELELLDDSQKDDEERRLENVLFGTKYVPAMATTGSVVESGEMKNLADMDLFYVDDAQPTSVLDDVEFSDQEEEGDSGGSDEDDDDGSSDSHPESEHHRHGLSRASGKLRKLRNDASETTLTGRQYESRLRRQYETINPQPAWAKAAKDRLQEMDEAGINELFSSTVGILASRTKKGTLATGTLSIERLRDANQAGSDSGEIKTLSFHPSAKIPLLCVGSADRRIRLFNIDGHTSPLLQTLHIPTLPLSQSSANFHPSGSSLLLTGNRPFYFVYDLHRGEMIHKTGRGLWGSFDSSTMLAQPRRKRPRRGGSERDSTSGGGAAGMEVTAFNDSGSMLAVAGQGGNVHLVDWKSAAGQVVGSLKCGASIKSLWWTGQDDTLAALTNDSEVYLWDVGQRRCVRRWKDEGGFRGAGRAMAGARQGWLAIGSNTGLVNVYGADSFRHSEGTTFSAQPKAVKTIGNLTTAISTLRFNHDSQLMALASRDKKDALRVIHLPSLTAFSNWPTSSTPLGHVTAVDFSAQSEYLVIGNTRGKVLLYHLMDYGAARLVV
ncbi:unnamed protein product [Mycena citricolor]|uniref:WD40 repeat-like protein n=1 Tax=Mycena citricolor TaxID=2018698 RepID=A0AAD2JYB7_9AGAR|nr:unnamed protein product [Mycena citricolor]